MEDTALRYGDQYYRHFCVKGLPTQNKVAHERCVFFFPDPPEKWQNNQIQSDDYGQYALLNGRRRRTREEEKSFDMSVNIINIII